MLLALAVVAALAVVLASVPILRLVRPSVLLSATLVASIFSGRWDDLGSPLPLDRVFLVATLGALVVQRRVDLRHLGPRHFSLLALSTFAVATTAFRADITERDVVFAFLDRLGFVPFLAFSIAPLVFVDRDDFTVFRRSLLGLGAYLAATAAFETLGVDALVFPRYVLDPGVGIHVDRARGPFAEPVAMGSGLFVGLLAGGLTLADRVLGAAERYLGAAVVVVASFGVVGTLTRAVWLGAVIGIVVAGLASPATRRLVPPVLLCGTVAVAVMLVAVPGLADDATERVGTERSVWDRVNSNDAAIEAVAANPIAGVGFQQFVEASGAYSEQRSDIPLTRIDLEVHNVPLSISAELGLVGLALWLCAVAACMAWPLTRRREGRSDWWRLAALAFVCFWLVASQFGPMPYAFTNLAVWLLAGAVDRTRTVDRGVVPDLLAPDDTAVRDAVIDDVPALVR